MKRREFIRNTGTFSSLAVLLPTLGFHSFTSSSPVKIRQNFILKGFDNEQEESPSLVYNGSESLWMFSLRRLTYPKNSELISAFHFEGGTWKEMEPVTKKEGQYETPCAACAKGGTPVVAWTALDDNNNWTINVSMFGKKGFSAPYILPVKNGRSIHPVLLAPDKNRHWIAWENLYQGKLSIYISKYENGSWSDPFIIDKGENSCFDPALAEAANGDLYVAYGMTHGYHQNIEMAILDGRTFKIKKTIPVAMGGGLKNRININTRPALAFDDTGRLWISYENNRNHSRLQDGDNYTGDRCCAILTYENGQLLEPQDSGKWLFTGLNDHKPTFIKDTQGRLYLATHCGGNFDNAFWKHRLSWLDPKKGWAKPITILETSQKGVTIPPAMVFDKKNKCWMATCMEKTFDHENAQKDDIVHSRLTQLQINELTTPEQSDTYSSLTFKKTQVEEFMPDDTTISSISGHPRIHGEKLKVGNEVYTLIFGNLHEHSESSNCWPAGTDGTLHEDYRFGRFSEGYDFIGITDHGYTMTEVYWRKSIRLADFYNEPGHFVAIPSNEWTLTTDREFDGIQFGVGHYNVIFRTTEDARKYIRNKHEIFCRHAPESLNSKTLWDLLRKKGIDCVTIPHHPADEVHPVDWDVHDPEYVPVVEIFQCRGNGEYPGCPRVINLERHRPTKHKKAFINYALREKKYKMGFIGSGDHNSMGVGVAALWVKELSRDGILDALKNRRCFATTGDKMIIDFRVNGSIGGTTVASKDAPALNIKIKGQRPLDKIEILRNSEVIKEYKITDGVLDFEETFTDSAYQNEKDVLYYYVRATQQNNALGWSSPVWVEHS